MYWLGTILKSSTFCQIDLCAFTLCHFQSWAFHCRIIFTADPPRQLWMVVVGGANIRNCARVHRALCVHSGCIVMCWLALLPLALILVLLLVLLLALLHLPSELAELGAGVLVVLGCCWWQRRRCATQCHTVPAQCHTVPHSAT